MAEQGHLTLRQAKSYAHFILLPDDRFKARWDFLTAFLILLVSFYTPARIAFTADDNVAWIVVDMLVDFVFFLDIILTFCTAYFTQELTLVDNRKHIARNYI